MPTPAVASAAPSQLSFPKFPSQFWIKKSKRSNAPESMLLFPETPAASCRSAGDFRGEGQKFEPCTWPRSSLRIDCMDHLTTETFAENARAALVNGQLRGALHKVTSLFAERRLAAARSLDNWEELRSEARRIKDETLLNLDQFLEEFERNAKASGAQVHWARDAGEANEIVAHIARQAGARSVVKAK